MKHSLALIAALWLTGCAIFGTPTELDETQGWSVQRLYAEAQDRTRRGDYDTALEYLGKLESRYPHGRYATQAQLDTAYIYYKKAEPALCIGAANRFIKLHPNHPNIDYAYYIKGLATFNERGVVERLTKQQISDRDPQALRESFSALKELVTRYPNSRYAKDATQRMVHLVNAMAEHELHVARYYMKRTAYVAALNRSKFVLQNYPQSTAVEEALVITISAYEALGLTDLQQDALRILKSNYPNSRMLTGAAPEDKKTWWKFWENLI